VGRKLDRHLGSLVEVTGHARAFRHARIMRRDALARQLRGVSN
jgi:hypothetical protein